MKNNSILEKIKTHTFMIPKENLENEILVVKVLGK